MSREVIEAPIPGKIVAVNVCVGDKVEEDQELCTLQSMKMQNPILSPVEGKIVEVKIKPEQTVETGEVLIVIEEE